MNFQELKDKFGHKTKADLADIDLALQAAPFLVRKVEALEAELTDFRKRIKHFEQRLNKSRPFSYKGNKNGVKWRADLDDDNNLLSILFSGSIDHHTAKFATNNILPIISNLRKGCDLIIDFSGLSGFSKRIMFHFRKILYTLNVAGAEKVVYIFPPDETNIDNVFRKTSESIGYQVFTASSTEDAVSLLKRSGQHLKA